jgi:hypothetical protein
LPHFRSATSKMDSFEKAWAYPSRIAISSRDNEEIRNFPARFHTIRTSNGFLISFHKISQLFHLPSRNLCSAFHSLVCL